MSIQLRGERPGDEGAIDLINSKAFRSMDEANIVRLMRDHSPTYDRRYSVMAWDGDDPVGHVLFNPARLRLMGETVTAVAVGPVAVVPQRQRQGIAGEMLRYGHELAQREGFAFAFLFGHPSYYPRHGYVPCHGLAKIHIDVDKLPQPTAAFEHRPVQPADLPWLAARCAAEQWDVDLGWLWAEAMGLWSLPGTNGVMWWTPDGRRAAYTLAAHKQARFMLADDPEVAIEVIAAWKPKTLDQHPNGWLARHVAGCEWASCEVSPSKAGMAIELQPGALEPYMRAVEAGKRPCGATLFPLPFLAC